MTPEATTPEVPKVTVKRNVFDLSKFERSTLEAEIELKSVATIDEMNEAAGGDEEKLVKIFNTGYRRQQISEAKASMGNTDNFVSPKIVSGFVNTFKPLYPVAGLGSSDDKIASAARKEQIQKVYAFIRSTPALLDSIKQIAAAMKAAGAEESDDDENDSSDSE